MFGFGKSIKDPLADAKAAERWLATFPANDPLGMHAAVLVELAVLTERDARRSPPRLEAVFRIDAACEKLRGKLTVQYLEHGTRSTRVEHQIWQSLFDLAHGFLLCYQAFARDAGAYSATSKWQAQFAELVARQIMQHGCDAKIRLFRYEHWIPARWADLHVLFQTACSQQFERQQVPALGTGALTTIEQEFLRVLLLQLMDAGNLAPRDVEWVSQQLSEWCTPLRLSMEASTATSFFIDLGARTGFRRRGPQPLEGHVLFLDTRSLHAVLMQNVVMLEQRVREDPLSERTPRRADQLSLMTKLAAQVDPEFRPVRRRGERTSATGDVDAIVGFGKIAGFLRDDEAHAREQAKASAGSFDDSLEIATFGRLRNEDARLLEVARMRLANYASPGGQWSVRDVSQTGYRLIASMTAISTVTLGTLTAIRARGETLWVLGIVRRMKRQTSERAEVGLQMIANNLVGVELEEKARGDDDYLLDGMATTRSKRRFEGLFLTLNKRESDAPIRTLIVPAGEYVAGKRLQMTAAKKTQRIAFGRLLEQHREWVWATIDSLDAGSDDARPAGK
jgi:hypothetical protein